MTRFLLGAAEAGFFPGAIVYLNHWFPEKHRARAMGGFLIAAEFALTLGGPISGWTHEARLAWLGRLALGVYSRRSTSEDFSGSSLCFT